jgi:DNA-binding transcriptional ArsR family regulator
MKDDPNVAAIAALIGDPARANMLAALMDGRALTASELAEVAGVMLPTASGHLSKLEEAGLLTSLRQGRNRYFRLSGEDVAHAIETLMLLAVRTGHKRVRTGPREPALREARVCYDHLAGARGVQMFDSLLARGRIAREGDAVSLTDSGRHFAARLGVDTKAIEGGKRAGCLACLDWSERRDHLAGRMGAALFARIIELGWALRDSSSRAVIFSRRGIAEFDAEFSDGRS